jgi:hypothetical protein
MFQFIEPETLVMHKTFLLRSKTYFSSTPLLLKMKVLFFIEISQSS